VTFSGSLPPGVPLDICSRSQSSAGLRAIIGLFLLKLTDSIGGAVLTFSATVLAIIALCAQTSVLLRTFFATE
jgi:hypothetical protein